MPNPNDSFNFEEMDLTRRSSTAELSRVSMSPKKRFTESTDLTDDQTDSSTEDVDEDNLYALVDIPIEKYEAGSSLPSVFSIRDHIEFRRDVRSRSFLWCGLFLSLVGTIVVLTTALTLRGGKETIAVQQRPSSFHIKQFMVRHRVGTNEELRAKGAHKATLDWMANEDPLNLPIPEDGDDVATTQYIARYVMALLYFSTDGENWAHSLNFLSGKPICEWYDVVKDTPKGIWCDDKGEPTSVMIPANKLSGEIPKELGSLLPLESLVFSENMLSGEIPASLCNLVNLGILELDANALEGEIPSCIGDFEYLAYLDLSFNYLEGNLPQSMKKLHLLDRLFLENNALHGDPKEIVKQLENLSWLMLGNNEFSGYIDETMFLGMKRIEKVDLSSNNFRGNFDHFFEIETLSSLDLSNNLMRTSFPDHIPLNKNLKVLNLANNEFLTGSVPQAIANLTGLTHLMLSDNSLLGHMQPAIGSLKHLEGLFLANNTRMIRGEVPAEYALLENLNEVSLRNTNRVGGLPEWSSVTKLRTLDLAGNKFQYDIPESWASMTNLQSLLLSGNSELQGSVPGSFSALTSLQVALLDGTSLSGDISFMCKSMDLNSVDDGAIVVNCGEGEHEKCPCCVCCNSDQPWCSNETLAEYDADWEDYLHDIAFATN